jgi:hypothetical protein
MDREFDKHRTPGKVKYFGADIDITSVCILSQLAVDPCPEPHGRWSASSRVVT